MIDTSKMRVVVMAYPDSQYHSFITRLLYSWSVPPENTVVYNHGPLIVARNEAMRNLVVGGGHEWTVFIDKDMAPDPNDLVDFLDVDGDVVCAQSPSVDQRLWSRAGAFHCGMFRVRVEAARAIQPPWFMFEYTDDGCALKTCECTYFARKAREAGLVVAHAGFCGHSKVVENSWHTGG